MGISALFGTKKNIIEVLEKFQVYRLGLGQENTMGAISTYFATIVLFYDQCRHHKGGTFLPHSAHFGAYIGRKQS